MPLPPPPQTSDLDLLKQELLKKIPADVRAAAEKDLARLQGTFERGLQSSLRDQKRQFEKRFDQLERLYQEAAERAAKLEEKEQELQGEMVARSALEERDAGRAGKVREVTESLSRFEDESLACGARSVLRDGLNEKKKKEICFFLQEQRTRLEGLGGQ